MRAHPVENLGRTSDSPSATRTLTQNIKSTNTYSVSYVLRPLLLQVSQRTESAENIPRRRKTLTVLGGVRQNKCECKWVALLQGQTHVLGREHDQEEPLNPGGRGHSRVSGPRTYPLFVKYLAAALLLAMLPAGDMWSVVTESPRYRRTCAFSMGCRATGSLV